MIFTKQQIEFIHTICNGSTNDNKKLLKRINEDKAGYINEGEDFEMDIFEEIYELTLDDVKEPLI